MIPWGSAWPHRPVPGRPSPSVTRGCRLYSRISPEGDRIAFAVPGMEEMFLDDLNTAAAAGGLGARHRRSGALRPALGVLGWPTSGSRCASGTATPTTSFPCTTPKPWRGLVPDAELQVRPGESHLGTMVVGDEALRTVVDLWT